MAYGVSQNRKKPKKELTPEQQKAQEEALIKWVSEQIAIDKQTLMAKFPFTGNVISRLDVLVGHWDDVPTACTNGDKIWVDVLFYAKLDPEERLFVLAHECWHVILRHFLRKMNRNQELWNWATDLEIHFILTKEGLKAPFVLPHKPEWKDLSFEEIYDRLLDQAKKGQSLGDGKKLSKKDKQNGRSITISQDELGKGDKPDDFQGQGGKGNTGDDKGEGNGEGQEGEGNGSSAIGDVPKDWNQGKDSKNLKGAKSGKGFDSHKKKEDPDSKDDDPKEIEDRICGKIKAAADFTRKRNRGTLPSHLQGIVDDLPKNEIPWQQVLRQFVTQTLGGSRHWLPPNRRHVWKGMYMQSAHQQNFRGVVALDTSGSCIPDLPKFFGELVGLLNSFGKYDLDVIYCDADIQKVEHYSDDVNPPTNKEWKMYGGGGTDHKPVFKWIAENCIEPPNVVLCLTDGYTDVPEHQPGYPVLWVLTEDGQELPWGQHLRFKHNDNRM